ncbi:MAG: DUF1206 domain-containing protein [Phycisphaerae bacterium]
MNTNAPPHTGGQSKAEQAGEALKWAARTGYAARGVVYLMIGGLSLMAAIGSGGKTTGSRGALLSLRDESYGQVLLIVIGLGMVAYGIWRLFQAVRDPDDHGLDGKGIAIRTGLAVSGLLHLFLAVYTISLAVGWGFSAGGSGGSSGGGGGGGQSSAQTWSGRLMSWPGGQWILGFIALCILVAGIAQFVKAHRETYKKRLKLDYEKQRWANPVCKIGLVAKGISLCLIAILLGIAAWQHDEYEAGGLGKALSALRGQPFGAVLLGILAAGLIAFAIYSFIEAGYRRIQAS